MEDRIKLILDLSPEVQALLKRQGVDLLREIQRKCPAVRVLHELDPAAPDGSRDIVAVLYGAAAVITSLTPIVLAILKQITPPNRAQTWVGEEVETRHPDGTVSIRRTQFRATDEQRPWASLPSPDPTSPASAELLPPASEKPDSQP